MGEDTSVGAETLCCWAVLGPRIDGEREHCPGDRRGHGGDAGCAPCALAPQLLRRPLQPFSASREPLAARAREISLDDVDDSLSCEVPGRPPRLLSSARPPCPKLPTRSMQGSSRSGRGGAERE